ncbi:hypothetical protein CDV54_00340, partial [Paracoccus yeei]
ARVDAPPRDQAPAAEPVPSAAPTDPQPAPADPQAEAIAAQVAASVAGSAGQGQDMDGGGAAPDLWTPPDLGQLIQPEAQTP